MSGDYPGEPLRRNITALAAAATLAFAGAGFSGLTMYAADTLRATLVNGDKPSKPKAKAPPRSRPRHFPPYTLPSIGRANLGRRHPDYGMTVREHQAAKRNRIGMVA